MSMWSRVGTLGLVGFMAVNIVATACLFVLNRKVAGVQEPPVTDMGSRFPSFSGVDLQGRRWVARNAPCRVIRVTDDACVYCRKDGPSYAALVDAARRASCEILEVSPKAGKMADAPRPGITQLKYVDADIGSVLGPFVTPQTVILDGEWSLKSNRRGIFDEKSLASAIAMVDALAVRHKENRVPASPERQLP